MKKYYRSLKNYQFFKTKHANRKNIIYAGSNSGVLHAIDAKTGLEEWAFVPPFIAGKFPTIINEDLDGATEGIVEGEPAGGSNAIFGVDGSPVVRRLDKRVKYRWYTRDRRELAHYFNYTLW